jgi:hypothetical protein
VAIYPKVPGLDRKEDVGIFQKAAAAFLIDLVNQIIEISFVLTLEKSGGLTLEAALRPQPGGAVAQFCAYLGRARSRFTRLPPKSIGLRVHFPPPQRRGTVRISELPPQLLPLVPVRERPLVLKLAQTLAETLDTDGLDFCVLGLPAPAGSGQTILFGIKVQHGRKLDLLVRDLVRRLPAVWRKQFVVRWNHARRGGVRIHKVGGPGGEIALLVAIRDDAVFLTEATTKGEKGLGTVLATPLEKSPGPTSFVEFRVDSANLLDTEAKRKAFRKMAPGADASKLHLRVTLTGGADLRLRLETTTLTLKFLAAPEDKP